MTDGDGGGRARGEVETEFLVAALAEWRQVIKLRTQGRLAEAERLQSLILAPLDLPLDGAAPPVGLVAPLYAADVEHYEWLIDGLLVGLARMSHEPIEWAAIGHVRDLFADLVARIVPAEEAAPGAVPRAPPDRTPD